MVTRLLIATLAVGVSTAEAAPFGELPFRPVPTAAVCVRATGVPGELIRWSKGGFTLIQARADGLVDVGTVPLGTLNDCPAVAADATSGAAVVAGATKQGIRVVLRAPGGGWNAPTLIRTSRFPDIDAAVSASGDAVLAWVEYEANARRSRTRVARHTASGWTVDDLTSFADESLPAVATGMSANGDILVAYTQRARQRTRTRVLDARAGGKLGAPRTLATGFGFEPTDIAVAPDGRALVAAGGRVFERPPGGRFAPVFRGEVAAMALRPDGGAALAFGAAPNDPLGVVVRDAPGPFGPVLRSGLSIPQRQSDYGSLASVVPGSVPYERGAETRVAFGSDGRLLIVHPTEASGLGVATVAGGALTEHALLGSGLRDPLGSTPLVLADGTRAVAWSDNKNQLEDGAQFPRVHYAVEGAAGAPAAEELDVVVGEPRRRALRPAQSLELPVRCSGACDIRAWLPGRPANEDVTASLGQAGTTVLRFRPGASAVVPPGNRPLKVTVRFGPPGSREPAATTVTLRLKRLPNPPLGHILNLRARRVGSDLVVRWDTDRPTKDAYFVVVGTRTRDRDHDLDPVVGVPRSQGRHLRVRLKEAGRVRFVTVELVQFAGSSGRSQTIRVG